MEIERRCTVLQETLPVADSQSVGSEILDSVTVRLVGICKDGTVNCLTPPKDGNTVDNPVKKVLDDAKTLDTALKQARAAVQSLPGSATIQANTLMQSIDAAQESLNTYRTNLGTRITKLTDSLRGAEGRLKQPCQQRSSCIIELAQVLQEQQEAIANTLIELVTDVAAPSLQNSMALLGDQANQLANTYQGVQLKALTDDIQNVQSSTKQLVTDANALSGRAGYGITVLKRVAYEGQIAVGSYFFSPQFDEMAADRVLGVLDQELQRTEHLIDQFDSRFYAVGSIFVNVYSSDIQHALDHAYSELEKTWFTNGTARLALAQAACTRMEAGRAVTSGQSSLFMPFLLSMFTNLQVEAEAPKQFGTSIPALDIAREKKLDDVRGKFTSEHSKEATGTFDKNLASTVNELVANGDLPSQSRQVSACTNIEIQKSKIATDSNGLRSDGKSIHASAQQQCAVALATTDSNSNAAVAVVPAPPDVSVESLTSVCNVITARGGGIRCDMTSAGAVIEFSSYFKANARTSNALEAELAVLGEILALHQVAGNIEVEGFASRAPVPCKHSRDALYSCGDQGNDELSLARAKWAASILSRRCPSVHATPKGNGAVAALDNDTELDRRIRVRLPAALTVGNR
ncbi:hypothetical protein [Burkholderia pseudomallei]|uniref:hypothetical protein n=1 Tax=Burkholderia pseudomallei TaxID=28450 RepID=UPI0012B18663|nr:hypothetical protein [Burkholderia pseudomallei]